MVGLCARCHSGRQFGKANISSSTWTFQFIPLSRNSRDTYCTNRRYFNNSRSKNKNWSCLYSIKKLRLAQKKFVLHRSKTISPVRYNLRVLLTSSTTLFRLLTLQNKCELTKNATYTNLLKCFSPNPNGAPRVEKK